ncbi:MAG TPA: hypothetical protein P5084_07575, partial [Paludibacter sp.]|nr:hypothetical protein [Paludibacter sp.]
MKKISILFVLFIICFSTFSQVKSGFKNPVKNTTKQTPGFLFQNISGSSSQNQTITKTTGNFNISPNLKLPDIKSDSLKNIRFNNGNLIFCERARSKAPVFKTNTDRFYNFHNAARRATKLQNPKRDLKIISDSTDQLGITHIKAQQYLKGVRIYGGESYVHFNSANEIFTGHILPVDTTLNLKPEILESTAIANVISDLKTKTTVKNLSGDHKKILKYEKPEISLVVYENKLAFEIKIRPNFIQDWRYFVDAQSGEIIHSFNNTNSDG